MQIGLRFAAANLPGLRTDRVVGSLMESNGALVPEESIVDSGRLPFADRQVRV